MVEEWNAILVSILINLVDSMRRRCEEVIEKNGERTVHLIKFISIKSTRFKLLSDI